MLVSHASRRIPSLLGSSRNVPAHVRKGVALRDEAAKSMLLDWNIEGSSARIRLSSIFRSTSKENTLILETTADSLPRLSSN